MMSVIQHPHILPCLAAKLTGNTKHYVLLSPLQGMYRDICSSPPLSPFSQFPSLNHCINNNNNDNNYYDIDDDDDDDGMKM